MSVAGVGGASSWLHRAARQVGKVPDGPSAALAAVTGGLLAAGVMVGGRASSSPRESDAAELLRHIDANAGLQLVSAACRVAALVLCVWLAVRLTRRVRQHTGHPQALLVLSVIGPLGLALATVAGWVALDDAATQFAAGAGTEDRAEDLLSDDALTRMALVGTVLARVLFGAWLVMLCITMARAKLSPAGVTWFGVAAGGLGVLLDQVGDALFFGWLASVVFLACGYWPGGAPRGWARREAPGG